MTNNISHLEEVKKITFSARVAWTIWLLISLFYAYQYAARIMPTVIMPSLMEKFNLDAGSAGHYNGMYYIGYVLIHIPLGIILDHFSSKKVIPVCILFTAIGIFPIVYTDNWPLSLIGRLLIGAGSAGAAIGAFKLIRISFGEERFTRILGYMVTVGLLTATYASSYLATAIDQIGWKNTSLAIAIIGIILALFTYLLFPQKTTDGSEALSVRVVLDDLKYIVSRKLMWVISILGGFLIGVFEGFADAWGVPFLKEIYHLKGEVAASVNSLIPLGMAAGLIVLGYLSEKLKAYYGLIIACSALMIFVFLWIIYGVSNIKLLYGLFFVLGVCCAYQLLVIGKATLSASEEHASLTAAVVNMIMMSFGFFFHVLIGKVMDATWDGALTEKGVRVYNAISYKYSMSIVVVGLIIGFIGFAILSLVDKNKKAK